MTINSLRADGIAKFHHQLRAMTARIGDGWWYGATWSIVDTYLYWAYTTAERGGFPLENYPVLLEHAERLRARPSFQRVLARESAALQRRSITDISL